ncbi:hypothetical protein [Pedobacter sp. WC2423]|uniref:hypothetical protein n=1 Tax=Pedobacter sp. WC2423 TaxID=3234142 RepID=UPI003467D25B
MRNDILLNEDFDLVDLGDEWYEGDSDQQHVELLMTLNKGELHEFPFVGFGALRRLHGVFNKQNVTRDIKIELENDGYTNCDVDLENGLGDLKITI